MKMALRVASLFVGASLFIVAGHASATTLSFQDSRYLGYVDKDAPADAADQVSYVNILNDRALNTTSTIDGRQYVRTGVSCGTCADAVVTNAMSGSQNDFTGNFGANGFQYFIGKYGDRGYVWNISGLTGTFSVPATIQAGKTDGGGGGGLSGWLAFNPQQPSCTDCPPPEAPEPATLALFGLGLLGVGRTLARRRRA